MTKSTQRILPLSDSYSLIAEPPKGQLLKWIGNKQRVAQLIVSYFPPTFRTYFEPFLGAGAVLATVSPKAGVGSDSFEPLMGIWKTLKSSPQKIKDWYRDRWQEVMRGERVEGYEKIKASYNGKPNAADLLFLCRSCYGGVVRFRKRDGYMSTPCGIHKPMLPDSFSRRVDDWHERVRNTEFRTDDYQNVMNTAKDGDLVYCDPPYSHSQAILYGAQTFSFDHLLEIIAECKDRGVYVALSIDGTKKSGNQTCCLPIPDGLFKREILVPCGRSMLKRFQMEGKTLEDEEVADRLMLTY